MKKRQTIVLTFVTAILASCTEFDNMFSERYAEAAKAEFDFSLVKDVNISIDYGALSAYSFVDFYLDNPLAESTGPEYQPDNKKAIYSTAIDAKGRFEGSISVPSYAKRLYAYSPSYIAPQIMVADIKDGKATFKQHRESVSTLPSATRAGGEPDYVVRKLDETEFFGTSTNSYYYTIMGSWDPYGKAEDVNHLTSEGTVTASQIASVMNVLWNGKSSKPPASQLQNSKYVVDDVNMTVTETFEENNETYDVESAQIWLDFINEQAWNENSFGYYYYDKNTPPNNASEITKRFIIIPNASVSAHSPFIIKKPDSATRNFYPDYAPMHTNKKIQLLYEKSDGTFTKNFPPNTVVGFFLIVNGYNTGKTISASDLEIDGENYNHRDESLKKININTTTYFSNYKLNSEQKKRYIALKMSNGSYVYGIEDGGDGSYDDFLFTISATPQKAVKPVSDNVTEVPDLPKDKETIYTSGTSSNTYCFENMWPDGGDYDINDLAVYHTRKYTYNKFNFVNSITDTFKFFNVDNTKSITRFGIQIPSSEHGTMELPKGVTYEEETGSLLFSASICNPKIEGGKTITITRENLGVSKNVVDEEWKLINPYIINDSKGQFAGKRVEIHMPNHSTTSLGLSATDVIDSALDLNGIYKDSSPWFTSKDGKYPYALTFPNIDWTTKMPVDKQRISDKYPNFTKWVESEGKAYTDWYK